MELLSTTMAYLDKQVKNHVIDNYEPVVISHHCGNLNGFVLVRGDLDQLSTLNKDDEFLRLVTKGGIVMENFGVTTCYLQDSFKHVMKVYADVI